MNIDEFRAMKEEIEKSQSKDKETSDAQTKPTTSQETTSKQDEDGKDKKTPETNPSETKNDQTEKSPEEKVEDKKPDEPLTVEIDGQKVTVDELKNGYLRYSDYTRKTQELSRKEKQANEALKVIEQINANPQLAQQLTDQFSLQIPDANKMKQEDLEAKYYDLLIQTELHELHNKYDDVDDREILETAQKEGLTNLESAYHIVKARKGGGEQTQNSEVETLKQELENLKKQLKDKKDTDVDTTSIIQSQDNTKPPQDDSPKLSPKEIKVASMMGMSPKEYATWRDTKKKK